MRDRLAVWSNLNNRNFGVRPACQRKFRNTFLIILNAPLISAWIFSQPTGAPGEVKKFRSLLRPRRPRSTTFLTGVAGGVSPCFGPSPDTGVGCAPALASSFGAGMVSGGDEGRRIDPQPGASGCLMAYPPR